MAQTASPESKTPAPVPTAPRWLRDLSWVTSPRRAALLVCQVTDKGHSRGAVSSATREDQPRARSRQAVGVFWRVTASLRPDMSTGTEAREIRSLAPQPFTLLGSPTQAGV